MITYTINTAAHVRAACDGAQHVHIALHAHANFTPLDQRVVASIAGCDVGKRNGGGRLAPCNLEVNQCPLWK